MSTNQAIARRSSSSSFTFTGKPSEETRKALLAAGYQFDARSRQWYRNEEENGIVAEEVIATQIAAQASPVAAQAATAVAQASPAAAVQKVNANTASIDQIQAALESAGVPNAARWAREVDEYRPYPTDDPSFAKLRQNLAKYNPSPDVVEKIVSALSPS